MQCTDAYTHSGYTDRNKEDGEVSSNTPIAISERGRGDNGRWDKKSTLWMSLWRGPSAVCSPVPRSPCREWHGTAGVGDPRNRPTIPRALSAVCVGKAPLGKGSEGYVRTLKRVRPDLVTSWHI